MPIFKPKANDKFKVYILHSCGYFYYGMTSSLHNRKEGHARAVHELLRTGAYTKLPSETGMLLIHHKIAQFIVKRKQPHYLSYISGQIALNTCFESNDKDQALYVEAFLVKESLIRKYCCNQRSHFMLLEGRKSLKKNKYVKT